MLPNLLIVQQEADQGGLESQGDYVVTAFKSSPRSSVVSSGFSKEFSV